MKSHRLVFMGMLLLALSSCGVFDEDIDDDSDYGDTDGTSSATCDPGGGGDQEAEWAALECRVFDLVNERRSVGGDCGDQGSFGPAGPLAVQSALSAAARRHSLDMGERDYFDHASPGGPDGDDMVERVENAGYVGWTALGENISGGRATAEETVDGWMDSPGHCANILNPDFTQIGVGYAQVPGSKYTHYWTQNFGRR